MLTQYSLKRSHLILPVNFILHKKKIRNLYNNIIELSFYNRKPDILIQVCFSRKTSKAPEGSFIFRARWFSDISISVVIKVPFNIIGFIEAARFPEFLKVTIALNSRRVGNTSIEADRKKYRYAQLVICV